jgi:carbamoyl-phosphate synthase large subunit
MKSVGETMAIGRTFTEALQKGLRSLEIRRDGWEAPAALPPDVLRQKVATPSAERIFYLKQALASGISIDELFQLTKIDRWFLRQLYTLLLEEEGLRAAAAQMQSCAKTAVGGAAQVRGAELLRRAKQFGFSDRQLARLWGVEELTLRRWREAWQVEPSYYLVDTCAAEFEARTPYYYSTYEQPALRLNGAPAADTPGAPASTRSAAAKKTVMVLGGGPNRIGQGIEFDYCCVHAVQALREEGFETLMINCNPETVSTDYDTADRLYFEPLTREDVLEILDAEKPEGIIVQFGGQTPLRLAVPLQKAGIKLLGTSADAIDRAEDRQRFGELVKKLGLQAPKWGTAHGLAEARKIAEEIGYPVMVRPSYVLGGRAMEIVHDASGLEHFVNTALEASRRESLAGGAGTGDEAAPILVDQFLRDAIEIDVDVVADGTDAIVGGLMEHIEEAGIHSGDSACALPPFSLSPEVIEAVKTQARALARELGVRGLMNVQFAVPRDGRGIFILEVNPRASRTVPFVSKVTGVPLAKVAAKIAVGRTLRDMGIREVVPTHVAVKEAVFPFVKFPGVDTILGPEMRSTGEVMGIDRTFEAAFAKSQIAAGTRLPIANGKPQGIFLSVQNADKPGAVAIARDLRKLGFRILATAGTSEYLKKAGVESERVNKVSEGRPHCVDRLLDGDIVMVINTTSGGEAIKDSFSIRRTALMRGLPYCTTISGARATVGAIATLSAGALGVCSLQEFQQERG